MKTYYKNSWIFQTSRHIYQLDSTRHHWNNHKIQNSNGLCNQKRPTQPCTTSAYYIVNLTLNTNITKDLEYWTWNKKNVCSMCIDIYCITNWESWTWNTTMFATICIDTFIITNLES